MTRHARGLAALLLVAAGGGLGACRTPRIVGPIPPGTVDVRAEPGAYEDDPRAAVLLALWPETVARSVERLTLVTGLKFGDVVPEVVVAPLGDETRAYDLRTAVRDGRRVPVLRVNLERLASGAEDPSEVLGRALAVAALENAAQRSGSAVPPWLATLAGAAAGGALSERVERLARDDLLAGREPAARVDPDDPRLAEPTALAAVVLLLERGGPALVRRFLDAVVEGDPANEALGRMLKDARTMWAAARGALDERLADVDREPWQLLLRAEKALAETGRAGLLATLEGPPPDAVADEIAVLGARAALAEGDADAARAALRALPDDVARRLRNPLEALVLRLRVEALPGGDPGEAALRLAWLQRDFPRTGGADRLRAELRVPEGPEHGLASLRRLIEWSDLETIDLGTLARYVDLLHRDHRDGAAQRLLTRLGERGTAPELAELSTAVAEGETRPGDAALEAARARVLAWRAAPDPHARRDVAESGSAGARALLEALASGRAGPRADAVALVGEAAGPGAVVLLVPEWERAPALLAQDLEALAASVRLPELEVWVRTRAAAPLAANDPDRMFDALRLDLDPEWVREHPDEPRALRSADYAVRRAAFERADLEGQAVRAPTLVARFLNDPTPWLRREAVRVAGTAGFEALVRSALEDPSPWVRRAACLALARAADPASLAALAGRLGEDPAPSVRAGAATALWDAAPGSAATIEALVAALGDSDTGVRQGAFAALATAPPERLSDPVLLALEREAARREPRGNSLLLLFRLYDRVTGRDVGYYPGMPTEEVRTLVARIRRPRAGGGR